MAALHEAGHAVVTLAMGWRPGWARVGHANCLGRDGEYNAAVRGLDATKAHERRLILACMLAGLEAERRRSHRSVLELCAFGGAGGDYNAAVALVATSRRAPPDADAVAREIEAARKLSRDLVARHWRAVLAVAAELCARKQLSGAEIARLAGKKGAIAR